MFGISDWYVLAAYLLCILSALACIVYGLANWNRGHEDTTAEDIQWAQEEKQAGSDI